MSDNSFGTTYGPSTPGAIEVVSGMTGGADVATDVGAIAAGDAVTTTLNGVTATSVIGDPDPFYDDCSGSEKIGMLSTNKNVGDLLGAKGISWGWFQGGFTPTTAAAGSTPAKCATTTNRIDGTPEAAYSAHHNPFQYYKSTSNPHHIAPSSVNEVGHDGQANHQYDLTWFQKAAKAGSAGSQLPEGEPRERWSPEQLVAVGRAGVHRERSQFPADAAGMGEHRSDHRVGRLGRMV